jgi:hypothetical protein
MTIKENIQELQDRMKYSGFGETLNKELEKQIKAGKLSFELNMIKEIGGKKIEYDLNFRKSDEGKYYYNGFDAKLAMSNGQEQSQRFYHNQGISAKEALNLLEGRAVFKSMFNKDGERYNAWLKLDLEKGDKYTQHPVLQYHQNYGYILEKAMEKLPLANMQGMDQRDLLMYSLKKGNLHEVRLEGRDGKFLLEANPKFKTLNVYDETGKRLKKGDLNKSQKKATVENTKKSTSKSRGKGVKA